MEDGFAILRHAIRMIFHDIWATLRITVGPVLLAVVAMVGIFMTVGAPGRMRHTIGLRPDYSDPAMTLALLLGVVVAMVCITWISVAWHRYALLSEPPGPVLPRWRGAEVWSYILAALKLAALALVLLIPAMFALGVLIAPFTRWDGAMMIIGTLLQIALTVFFLRLSLILPAAALGKPLSLGASWSATRGMLGAIATVAAAFLLMQLLNQGLARGGLLSGLLALALSWFSVMLSLSVLTTLYGARIEGRALT